MKKLLVVLLMTMHPQLAAAEVDPNIKSGNFEFTKPYLMSVTYSRSSEDNTLFGLAITTKEQNKDRNGLDIPGAMIMNCKTEIFSAALYFELEGGVEASKLIAGSFCYMHKKYWSHSDW